MKDVAEKLGRKDYERELERLQTELVRLQSKTAAEDQMRREWEGRKGNSRLDWSRARLAIQRAWERGADPHGT